MKTLNKLLLTLSLLTGSVYAQVDSLYISKQSIQRYSVDIKTDKELSQGINNIDVKIRHKSHIVNNAKVLLKMYTSGNKMLEYKSKTIDENGNYTFNVELPKEGKYTYVLSFNRVGGVVRSFRGNFKL